LGISADALTVFGLLASVVTAFLIGSGHLGWAVVGVIVAGVSDLLDGAIARGSGQASPRGAFFDSVTDRVSDALLLGGTAWYLLGQGSPYLSMLAFAVGACSMLISYERARAEALGLDARGGLMERAGRVGQVGPASVAPPAGRMVGRAASVLMPSQRGMAGRHQRRAVDGGEPSVDGVFESYGRYWIEMLRLPGEVRAGEVSSLGRIEG